jgi:integrase/recombinase XerD
MRYLEDDMTTLATTPKPINDLEQRKLTDKQFLALAEVPPEVEWFANLKNPNTRRAYQNDVKEFMAFVGISKPEEFRKVTRAHVIAWRDEVERREYLRGSSQIAAPLFDNPDETQEVQIKNPSAATIRRKLSALSSLFDYLCESNAVTHNPVKGVKRPNEGSYEGKTPALGDSQARALLNAPDTDTLKGKRDKAMIAILLFHAVRREEVAKLRVKDVQTRQGILHFQIKGKGDKIRYLPVNPDSQRLIAEYLETAGHGGDKNGALFRPIKNNVTKTLKKHFDPSSISRTFLHYATEIGLKEQVEGRWVHLARATAITNALEHGADIAKVQEWAGHASIATTRLYDRRHTRPEESPTFRVRY